MSTSRHKFQSADKLTISCEMAIEQWNMLLPGDGVLIGVSGGPDSVALLHVLIYLSRRHGYRLGIAHINHGLRASSSDDDARFVEYLAKTHDLPYYIENLDLLSQADKTRKNLEEAGREARYRFFHQIAMRDDYERIAVGHHGEDNAEWILLNLIRGSGPSGMRGIPPVRDKIIRPMINASRKDVLHFLCERQIDHVHDHTNDQSVYRRNHIRHHLIPALEQYNPRIVETINRFSGVFREEDEWIEQVVAPMLEHCITDRQDQRLELCLHTLASYPDAPLRRIIRRAINEAKGDLRCIEFTHVDAVVSLIRSQRSSAQIDLPDRLRVLKQVDRIILIQEKKSLRSLPLSGRKLDSIAFEFALTQEQAASARIRIEAIDMTITLNRNTWNGIKGSKIKNFSGNTAAMDWDRLEFPIVIRNIRPGDRFRPLGMDGSQKVADFLANNKIPAAQRGRIPLVISGHRVVWIAGFRIDEQVKITESTLTVLMAQIVT